MKCSNKKCKGISLDVARTYTDVVHVQRDRKCPRCGSYYKTIEMFVSDRVHENNNFGKEIQDRDSKIRSLTSEIENIKTSLSQLFQFAGIGVKGSKKT